MTADENIRPHGVGLYEEQDGRQVPTYRHWLIPEKVLSSPIGLQAKLLLGLMYRHADPGGHFLFHGQQSIGEAMGLSSRAAGRHLRALAGVLLIKVFEPELRCNPDSYQVQLRHPWMQGPVADVPTDLRLSPAARLIYGWLSLKQGGGEPLYWTLREVGAGIGFTDTRHATKTVVELERAGYLTRHAPPGQRALWVLHWSAAS